MSSLSKPIRDATELSLICYMQPTCLVEASRIIRASVAMSNTAMFRGWKAACLVAKDKSPSSIREGTYRVARVNPGGIFVLRVEPTMPVSVRDDRRIRCE